MQLEKLLLVEDEQTGHYCCNLQNEHRAQKAQLADVLDGKRQRNGGALALGWCPPRTEKRFADEDDQPDDKTIAMRAILPLENLEALMLADKPGSKIRNTRRRNPTWCFFAIAAPHWLGDGSGVQIGEDEVCYNCNFFNMPRRLTQEKAADGEHAGYLESPRAGELVLYRVGEFLDLCVGTHNGNTATIVFRFYACDFLPSAGGPSAVVLGAQGDDLDPGFIAEMEFGKQYRIRDVSRDSAVVSMQRPIAYKIAHVERSKPDNERNKRRDKKRDKHVHAFYVSDTLSADTNSRQRRRVRAGLKMNAHLIEGTDCHSRLQEIRTLIEFPPSVVGNFVVGEFQPTVELEQDVLAALGPKGLAFGKEQILLKVEATTTSKVKAISRGDRAVVIVYEDGREQFLPPMVDLKKLTEDGLVDLAVGMEVKKKEAIGDYVERFAAKVHDLAELKGMFLENLANVEMEDAEKDRLVNQSIAAILEAFIARMSVTEPKFSTGILIDYRYAEPHMKRSEKKSFEQKVFLDCSSLLDLYDEESRFIIIPFASANYPVRHISATSVLRLEYGRRREERIHTLHKDKSGKETSSEEVIETAE